MKFFSFENLIQKMIHAEAWPIEASPLPPLQIHRGFHAEGLQENSIAAFQAAAARGARMCECDVRLSADQIPVVVHDPDLRRLLKKKGAEIVVAQTAAQALRQHANIPQLKDLFLAPGMPAQLNIELKVHQVDSPLPRKVAELIRQYKKQNSVIVSSFNPIALWKMQNLIPQVPRALLVSAEAETAKHFLLRSMALAPLLKLQMLNMDYRMINKRLMQNLKQRIQVAAWTVNDVHQACELRKLGVKSLISDIFLPEGL